jgi:hypothetical protein
MFGDLPSGQRQFWIALILILIVGLVGLLLMWAFHA